RKPTRAAAPAPGPRLPEGAMRRRLLVLHPPPPRRRRQRRLRPVGSAGGSARSTIQACGAGEARVRIELQSIAFAFLFATPVRAAESETDASNIPSVFPTRTPRWIDLTATTFIGDGLRFNNPYRLATVLGST